MYCFIAPEFTVVRDALGLIIGDLCSSIFCFQTMSRHLTPFGPLEVLKDLANTKVYGRKMSAEIDIWRD